MCRLIIGTRGMSTLYIVYMKMVSGFVMYEDSRFLLRHIILAEVKISHSLGIIERYIHTCIGIRYRNQSPNISLNTEGCILSPSFL